MVDERTDVLLVPNAALRWRPRDYEEPAVADTAAPAGAGNATASAAPAASAPGGTGGQGQRGSGKRGKGNRTSKGGAVWVLDNGKPSQVKVRTGLTDGVSTEIISGLEPGQQVIVGENTGDSSGGGGTTNPFAPQFFRGGGNRR
jgi:HlyD family secretion protein